MITILKVHGAQYIAPTKASANTQQSKTNSIFGGTTNCTIIHEESQINGSMSEFIAFFYYKFIVIIIIVFLFKLTFNQSYLITALVLSTELMK